MKYILTILILLTGCNLLDECQPGDSEKCECGINSYINYCTMDGFYYDCNCYQNDGSPITNEQAQQQEDISGTMSGGDQEDLTSWFPADYPVRNCDSGEIAIPNTNQCWRICPAGMDWVNGICQGYPQYHVYEEILATCKSYRPDYHIVTMEEIINLLDECYPMTFSTQTNNYCSSYLSNPIRNVMQLPNESTFNTWIGGLETCTGIYGDTDLNCAWEAMFYLKNNIPTEFNFFRAVAQVGSVMSGGICVRD